MFIHKLSDLHEWTIILFTQRLSGICFYQLFPGSKITVVFVRILSRSWSAYYCVIYTQFIVVCFNIFFSESKVNTVFVHNLSSLRCVNYRYIYLDRINGDYFVNIFSPSQTFSLFGQCYRGIYIQVIKYAVCILPCYLQFI